MVTNVTPVEQDDNTEIPLIESGDLVIGYDPLNPGAGVGAANKFLQSIANTLLYLKRRTGIADTWDLTPLSVACEPDNAYLQEATWTKTDNNNYEMTPTGGVSQLKCVGGAVIDMQTTNTWARIATPNAGGNLGVVGMMFSNESSTLADALTTLFTGTLTGTCTGIMNVFLDVSGAFGGVGSLSLMTVSGGGAVSNSFTVTFTPGTTDLRIGVRSDGSIVTISVDNGTDPVDEQISDPGWAALFAGGTLRPYVITYFGSSTPTFPDGTLNFDLGDSTGGRAANGTYSPPSLPSGATDGKRYLVTGAGTWGGRVAAVGDIVELHTGTTLIQIIPAVAVTPTSVNAAIAAYLIANPTIDLVTAARIRGELIDCANDVQMWSPAPTRGAVCIVGSAPTGAFSAFTPETPVIYDGAAWQQAAWSDLTNAHFVLASYAAPAGARAFITDSVLNVHDHNSYFGPGATFGSASVAYSTLRAAGLVILSADNGALSQTNTVGASGTVFLEVGTYNVHSIEVTGGPTLTVYPNVIGTGSSIQQYVEIQNNSGGTLTITFAYGGGTYTVGNGLSIRFLMLMVGGAGAKEYRIGYGIDETARADAAAAQADANTALADASAAQADATQAIADVAAITTVVTSESDFPTAVAGVITLPANSVWRIKGFVSITSGTQIVASTGVMIYGTNPNQDYLYGTVVGAGFVVPAGDFTAIGVGIHNSDSTNAASCAVRKTSVVAGTYFLSNCRLSGMRALSGQMNVLHAYATSFEFTISGASNAAVYLTTGCDARFVDCDFYAQTSGSSCVVFDGTTSSGATFTGCYFSVQHASAYAISVTGGATWTVNGGLVVCSCRFIGTATNMLSGLAVTDNHVTFSSNYGVVDSIAVGHLYMNENATATTVGVISTFYKAAGTTSATTTKRFTHSNNRLTYTGVETKTFTINVQALVACGSSNQIIGGQIAKNGSLVTGTRMRTKLVSAGNPSFISITKDIEMANGDYIEFFVANDTATQDLTVADLLMNATSVP